MTSPSQSLGEVMSKVTVVVKVNVCVCGCMCSGFAVYSAAGAVYRINSVISKADGLGDDCRKSCPRSRSWSRSMSVCVVAVLYSNKVKVTRYCT